MLSRGRYGVFLLLGPKHALKDARQKERERESKKEWDAENIALAGHGPHAERRSFMQFICTRHLYRVSKN
jgi:hypothetical protein